MGLEFVARARDRLHHLSQQVRRNYRLLARDALQDNAIVPAALALVQANAFVVRQDALSAKGDQALRDLATDGWVRAHRHAGGEDLVAPQVPEFFMSELADEMSQELERRAKLDAEDAAAWLLVQCERFFLGDLVGAQAIVDFGMRAGTLPLKLIQFLANDYPTKEIMGPGLFAFQVADGGIQNFVIDDEGRFALANQQGQRISDAIKLDDDEGPGNTYASMAWMILSQLARVRATTGDGIIHRVDIQLMLHVGSCKFPLMRGGARPKGHLVQRLGSEGEVLADEHALAEPITAAIYQLFATEWKDVDIFFERLVERDSLPLTVRVDHVLHALSGITTPGLESWAHDKLRDVVHPLLNRQMGGNISDAHQE
jgi:hypothetical protein